jgi:hypothetical protein
VRYESVLISVGKDTQIRATLELAAVSEAVSVSGVTPDINPRKTVTGANFDAVEMQEIPTSRDPWAILRQVPGVVVNQVNVGGNATGVQAIPASRGSTDIQYELDGVTITDPVDLGTPTYFNFDSFQEIQVATGGSDLTLRGSGVTLNLVTKRGSNELKGLARYFYASDRWQSDNTPEETRDQDLQSNRTALLRDYGIEAGGPLIKDRLWAWGAWGRNDISLDLIGNVLENGQTVRVDSTLEQFNFKLDAQPTPSDSTTFFFQHGDKRVLGRDIGPLALQSAGKDAARDQRGPTPLYKFEDSHVFSSSLVASGFLSYLPGGFELVPQADPQTQAHFDANGILQANNVLFRTSRKQRQAGANASKFFPTGRLSHELKFGFGYRASVSSSLTTWPGDQLVGDESSESPTALVTRAGRVRLRTETFSAYVGDTISADRLTINVGVRYDYGRSKNLPSSVEANPVFPDLLPAIRSSGDSGYPISAGTLQPRISATYAAGEKRKTLLRASYARFADQLLSDVFIANTLPGIQYLGFSWEDTNLNHRVDRGEVDISPCTGSHCDAEELFGFEGLDPADTGSVSSPNVISPGLRPMTTDEVTVGVDHEIVPDLTASLAYTHRDLRHFSFTPPIGVSASDYSFSGNATGTATASNGFQLTFDVPYYALTLASPPVGDELRNRPGYRQTYDGAELQLVKRLSHAWMLRASAAWNDWKQHVRPEGIFDPNNRQANLDGDVATPDFSRTNSRWQFNVSGLYQLPWGITVAGNLFGREGFPQRYVVTVLTHDVANNMPAILIGSVSDYRLKNVYELDLRVEKTFLLGSVHIVPSLDVFNVTNENTVLFRVGNVGTYDARSARPFRQRPTFNQITQVESPRIFRAGLRVSF